MRTCKDCNQKKLDVVNRQCRACSIAEIKGWMKKWEKKNQKST